MRKKSVISFVMTAIFLAFLPSGALASSEWSSVDAAWPNSQSQYMETSDGGEFVLMSGWNDLNVSSDGGATWTTRMSAPGGCWGTVAVSSFGAVMFADNFGSDSDYSGLWKSSNLGIDWARVTNLPFPTFTTSISDTSGVIFTTDTSTGRIWSTINGGFSWSLNSLTAGNSESWAVPHVSPDGSTIVVSHGHSLYLSRDQGLNWTTIRYASGISRGITSVALSENGSTVAFTEGDGSSSGMFVSRNYGMSWVSTPIPETNYFTSYTAMSDNGEQIVTSLGSTDYSDQKPKIYRSVDSGTTWSLTLDLSSMSVAIQGMHSSPSGNIVKVFLQDTAIYTGTFPNTYTVTYAYNSATAGNETDRANFTTGGTAITLPTPTQTGYTFAGWYSDAGLTSKIGDAGASYSPSGSTLALSAYAKWTRNLVKAVSTVRPAITGTAKVSKTLTAKKGIWSGYPTPAFTYQWYACSKKVTAAKDTVPSTCKKISGATKSTLKLLAAQKGKFISVLVTGKGTGTSATKWLSKSTPNVS